MFLSQIVITIEIPLFSLGDFFLSYYSKSIYYMSFSPGNPGVTGYYTSFMETIYMTLKGTHAVWAVSHAGHCWTSYTKSQLGKRFSSLAQHPSLILKYYIYFLKSYNYFCQEIYPKDFYKSFGKKGPYKHWKFIID